ncbi:Os08g0428300, partial [Oryza sativa Japonica Group]
PIKYVISCSIWEQAKDLHFLRPKQEGYLKKDGVKFNDITIMRFGPGQVSLLWWLLSWLSP